MEINIDNIYNNNKNQCVMHVLCNMKNAVMLYQITSLVSNVV